ncbi:MAG: O-antigen ligase family protein [Verrucomicrobiae bacterium]|nr:O-antigen ligase family protein [Verrucomicrobiae bacterium]
MSRSRGHMREALVINRHNLAQFFFLASGALALLLFGGAEPWAMAVTALALATACAYEAAEHPKSSLRFDWRFFIPLGLLALWLLLTLIPWPARWAAGLAPGQARLLAELPGFKPPTLHLSMAPAATWKSLFALAGAATVVGLSFRWAGESGFRQILWGTILALGVLAAALALADHLDRSDLILGLRATRHPSHWGVFVSRNHLAGYLNFAAMIGLGLFLRHGFPHSGHRRSRIKAALALGSVLVCLGGSLATASKGGLLSLGAGLLAFTVLLLMRKRSRLQLRIMVFSSLLLAALTLVYARPVVQRTEQWIHKSWGGESEGRWALWREAWAMGRDANGRGIGVGAFESVFPAWQRTNGHKIATHAENEYVQMLVEWGPAAALAWIAAGVLILLRATRTFRGNATEWQIAGWAALAGLALHAAVDFPFHMPANAWAAGATLGALLRGHGGGVEEEEDIARPDFRRRMDRFRLYATALILIAGAILGFADSRTPLRQARAALEANQAARAATQARRAVRTWPFYWRAHQYAGFAAAVLPGRILEAQRELRWATRLAQANPTVPLEAGLLFAESSPGVAQNFLETAVWVSDMPSVTLSEILDALRAKPALFQAVLQTGRTDPTWWAAAWTFARNQNNAALLAAWTDEGERAWLADPANRTRVIPTLLEAGRAGAIIEAFRVAPPATPQETYWNARALQADGNPKAAARLYADLWARDHPSSVDFTNAEIFSDSALLRVQAEPANALLQEKAGLSLMRQGRYADAVVCWERLLGLEPTSERAALALALCRQEAGDWDRAAAQWRSLLERKLHLAK